MRISEAAGLLAILSLAACGAPKVETKADRAETARIEAARAEAEGRIPCAIGGTTTFTTDCTIERAQTQDGLMLTVRHPQGGFHRLRVTTDGRGVVAADGAREAVVSIIDKDAIEVAIEDARYRLPARVRGADTK
ncbi:hypothetical protein [Sphingomonas sp. LT1P40]|uniref:hypothetical protein n=1 Tax=Alteristakelama amylovorans TaxID=3096166 RepID=UPI002FC803B6